MVLENSEKEEEDKEESIEKRIGAIIPPNEEEEAIDKEPFYRTVFNIMSLGTTTSVLPISKIPLNISIIMTPVCILITSLANIRSYYILADLSEKYQNNDNENLCYYEALCKKIFGRKISVLLIITLNIYTLGLILIHQIFIYRLLGGIINVIGGYEYDSFLNFFSDTYWNEMWVKICINFGIGILIIFPLCLMKDNLELKNFSTIGVFTILFILFVVIVQFPFYLIEYFEEYKGEDINVFNVGKGFTKQVQFFQALTLCLFCHSRHNGFLPILKNTEDKTPIGRKKVYKWIFSLDLVIYLIISIFGYLSVPHDSVDIIFERKKIWSKDIVMTIAIILMIPLALNKIQVNFNILKNSLFSFLIIDKWKEETFKFNIIFTSIILCITTLLASVYQNIVGYIFIIGGIFLIFPAFLFPSIMYISKCGLPKLHWKIILQFTFGFVLCSICFISGILGLIDIIKGAK